MDFSTVSQENSSSFDNHHSLIVLHQPDIGLHGIISIHRGNKKRPAFGATRVTRYETAQEAVHDAVSLAKLMSYKSAMAGLPYGGAKAVLIDNELFQKNREQCLERYALEVNKLEGVFVTGADIGISPQDVVLMKKYSEYMVGVENDPVYFTAVGIFLGIQAAVEFHFHSSSLSEHSFAIQGLGKIGLSVLEHLYKHTHNIFVSDVNPQACARAQEKFPEITVIPPEEIHSQKVDVFCPCAVSGSINEHTIAQLDCQIVAGGANVQLADPLMGDRLFEKGILYAPDYIINGGGLISVVDEYEHKERSEERVMNLVNGIPNTLQRVFTISKNEHLPPHRVANVIAREIIHDYE